MTGSVAERPLVTFAVPAFNAADFISETLDSVLGNPRRDIEVVVADDGSTDITPEILAARKDGRLKVVRQHNQGVSAARNAALAQGKGEYIVFLDADDLFDMNSLDALLCPMQTDRSIVASYGQYLQFIQGGRVRRNMPTWISRLTGQRPSGDVLEAILERNFVGALSAMCVRREAILKVGGFDTSLSMGEDWEAICRLAALGRFTFVDTTVVNYRQHRASATHQGGNDLTRLRATSDAIFANPFVVKKLSARTLGRLRRNNVAHLYAHIADREFRNGRLAQSLGALARAIATYPSRAPEMVARYAWMTLK